MQLPMHSNNTSENTNTHSHKTSNSNNIGSQLFGRAQTTLRNVISFTEEKKSKSAQSTGVYKLFRSVLLTSILDYCGYELGMHKDKEAYEAAKDWLYPNGDKPQGLFSIQTTCEVLKLNINIVHKTIQTIDKKMLEKIKHAAY